MRSSSKPLQALPLVRARDDLPDDEIAIACASHHDTPEQVEAVRQLLARAEATEEDLELGSQEGRPPQKIHHNCSGKHAGMLAWCDQHRASKGDYLAYDHPLQQSIRRAVSAFTGVAEARLVSGIDGCSAPNYAIPLASLATAFARLASADVHAEYGRAPKVLADAMTSQPEMVSGEHRSDLALMRAGRGDWVTKIGAEGVQAIGIRSQGVGVAVKVSDGQKRGLYPAVVAVLDELGLLDGPARQALAPWAARTVRNYRGIETGEVRAAVVLHRFDAS
jgi:L-asparaginase II